jgi:neutral ceramidase
MQVWGTKRSVRRGAPESSHPSSMSALVFFGLGVVGGRVFAYNTGLRVAMEKLAAQFKKVDITPTYPVRLAGYFNERVSDGVLDRLHLRLAVLARGESRLLFIQVDSCAVPTGDAEEIRNEIARRGPFKKHEIMLFTSHIHTGPDLVGFFGLERDARYLADLKRWIVEAVASLDPREESLVAIARTRYEGLAFNRRWWMKDGTVVTNPPKRSPERVKPEGGVDREANAIAFRDGRGGLQAFFVSVSNHTDTVGGTKITADWPGFMERHLRDLLGADIPVFPFLAPQGNINHLEFDSPRLQTNYEEAERLGRAYAEIVAASLPGARFIPVDRLEAREMIAAIPSREISESELRGAREVLERAGASGLGQGRDLTAEDLAKGDIAVEALFARELLRFAETKPAEYRVPLQAFKLGGVAFAAIPGEPFVEVGLALKAVKGYELIFPVALANGYFGYIPLPENFGRGGYETRPGSASRLSVDAADRILAALGSLL